MRFIQVTYLLIFLLTISAAFGQKDCNSLRPELAKKFDTYSAKRFDRLLKRKNLCLQTAFDIATYFRFKADTVYRQWYGRYIDLTYKKYRSKSDKIKEHRKWQDQCLYFYLGSAYYYIGDYKKAYNWLGRAKKAQCSEPCIDYLFSQIETKLEKKDK